MDERIGASLTIQSRSPVRFEAEMFVKAEGFRVLLVHIDRQVRMRGEDIADRGLSNALAVMIGSMKSASTCPSCKNMKPSGASELSTARSRDT